MVTVVRRLAKEEHSALLPHLASRISAILKFSAGTGEDPFAKVKGLITELISRLQEEASSETSQRTVCVEETSKANEKEEDPEADIAKHSSKLRQVPTGQTVRKPAEIPQVQFSEKAVDMPVVVQRQVHMVLTVQSPVEVAQLQILDKVVDMFFVVQQQVPEARGDSTGAVLGYGCWQARVGMPFVELRCAWLW